MKLKILFLAVTTESNIDRKWLFDFWKYLSHLWSQGWQTPSFGTCCGGYKPLKKSSNCNEKPPGIWGRPLNTAGRRKLFEAVTSHCALDWRLKKRSLRRPLSESTLVSVAHTVSSCLLLSSADCAGGALCYYRVSELCFRHAKMSEYIGYCLIATLGVLAPPVGSLD